MITLLHISDAHGHAETMRRLEDLAWDQRSADALAYTGDSFSYTCPQLPSSWSDWPQALKLAVPGEHDNPDTYVRLETWITDPPWSRVVEDVLLVGIDTRRGWGDLDAELQRSAAFADAARALILVFHHWPRGAKAAQAAAIVRQRAPSAAVAVLHGHEHPKGREDPEWDPHADLGGLTCGRSKVISSARNQRGVGALLTWDGARFECRAVSPA